jgi:hypothetical protein
MEVMHEQPGSNLFPYWTNLSIASRTYVKGRKGSPEGNVLRLEDNWLDQ